MVLNKILKNPRCKNPFKFRIWDMDWWKWEDVRGRRRKRRRIEVKL